MTVRVTQAGTEVVGIPPLRVTQVVAEIVTVPTTVRVTQVGAEVVGLPLGLRITQVGVGVIIPFTETPPLTVSNITAAGATLSIPSNPAHIKVQFRIAHAADAGFSSPVLDITSTAPDRFQVVFSTGFSQLSYRAQVRVWTATTVSAFSPPSLFTTVASNQLPETSASYGFLTPGLGEKVTGQAFLVQFLTGWGTAVDVYVSADSGKIWTLLLADLADNQCLFNSTSFTDGTDYTLEVREVGGSRVLTHSGFIIDNAGLITDHYHKRFHHRRMIVQPTPCCGCGGCVCAQCQYGLKGGATIEPELKRFLDPNAFWGATQPVASANEVIEDEGTFPAPFTFGPHTWSALAPDTITQGERMRAWTKFSFHGTGGPSWAAFAGAELARAGLIFALNGATDRYVAVVVETGFIWPYDPFITEGGVTCVDLGALRGSGGARTFGFSLSIRINLGQTGNAVASIPLPGIKRVNDLVICRWPYHDLVAEYEQDPVVRNRITVRARYGAYLDTDEPDRVDGYWHLVRTIDLKDNLNQPVIPDCGWTGIIAEKVAGQGSAQSARFFHELGIVVFTPGDCAPPGEIPKCPPGTPDCEPELIPGPLTASFEPCPPPGVTSPQKLFFLSRTPANEEIGPLGGSVLQFEGSELDHGVPITALATPREIYPAGSAGSTVFHALYFVLVHSGDALVGVTPILDGVRLDSERVEILLTGTGKRERHEYKIPLAQPYLVGGVEVSRYALRAEKVTFDWELIDVCSKGLLLEEAEVEVEEVREQLPPQMVTP